jgi:hypothetical protein
MEEMRMTAPIGQPRSKAAARTSLLFLGGTDTVGGVHILVRGRAGRLLLDIGIVGNPGIVRDRTLFNAFQPPRPGSMLPDYLRAGMAPLVESLYERGDLAPFVTVSDATRALRAPGFALDGYPLVDDEPGTDLAVFVSHLHDDHMALLEFVARNVPVIMSDAGARLHGALVAAGALPAVHAAVTGVVPGVARSVGDLVLHVILVDHDIPGAAGVLVETPDGTMAYTGDWRRHGRHPEAMQAFADACAGVDVLITDASGAQPPDARTVQCAQVAEREIASLLSDLATSAHRGLYCSFDERNLERHADVQVVAKAHGRLLVASPRTVAIWHAAASAGLPCPRIEDIAVWDDSEGMRDDPQPPTQPPIAPQTAPPPTVRRVRAADVAADPAAFLCELRSSERARLLDIGAGPGDVYAYLDGYPYGPADPGWPVLVTWMRQLGIRLETISSRGHAWEDDLRWLVDAVRPGMVIPVHTNHPDHFPGVTTPVRPVRRGDEIALSPGARTLSGDLR